MKIKPKVIISTYDDIKNPYYAGGGARAIHSVAKRLIKKYRIVVISSKFPGAKDEVIDGVRYKRIGVPLAGPKIGQLLFQLYLVKAIFSTEFDLWLESFTPPFSTSFLPLFTKKPVLGLVHMLVAEDMVRKYKLPFNFVENFGLRFYKYFLVVNKITRKKILQKRGQAQIFVIPNGVDLHAIHKPKGYVRKHILFMGRIEINQKGLDLLLASYKLVSRKIKHKLVIAGTGTKKEVRKLRKLITKFSLTRKVEVIGRIEGKKWENAFKNAWLVVIPSRYETFSMVALEALAFNTPVVAFDIEGLKWLPKTVCLKAKKFDCNQFAEYILKLSRNSIDRQRLVRNIPKVLSGYSWGGIAAKYDEVFQSVLKS